MVDAATARALVRVIEEGQAAGASLLETVSGLEFDLALVPHDLESHRAGLRAGLRTASELVAPGSGLALTGRSARREISEWLLSWSGDPNAKPPSLRAEERTTHRT